MQIAAHAALWHITKFCGNAKSGRHESSPDGWSDAIPINHGCEDDGLREGLNPSYASDRIQAIDKFLIMFLNPPERTPAYPSRDMLTSSKAMVGTMSRGSPVTKLSVADRFSLWISTSRVTDGLWIGTAQSDSEPALQRIEAALQLMNGAAPLHYRRIKNSLSRIWVTLVPHGAACYLHSLNACLLDERIFASETATLEWIASTIVHEATHARLEKRGIRYNEAVRLRIERICIRRELDFARHLSGSDALQKEITERLDWCRDGNAHYTDHNLWQEIDQGNVEALRHLGTPEWVIALVLKARDLRSRIRRFTRRMAGASVR